RVVLEESRSLHLLGELLEEADEPQGVPTFNGNAPTLEIRAERFEEVRKLDVQWRAVSDLSNSTAGFSSIQGLVNAGIGEWSSERRILQLALGRVLPDQAFGRFRLRLLQGLQNSRYSPVEFLVIPNTTVSPTGSEWEKCLY